MLEDLGAFWKALSKLDKIAVTMSIIVMAIGIIVLLAGNWNCILHDGCDLPGMPGFP